MTKMETFWLFEERKFRTVYNDTEECILYPVRRMC